MMLRIKITFPFSHEGMFPRYRGTIKRCRMYFPPFASGLVPSLDRRMSNGKKTWGPKKPASMRTICFLADKSCTLELAVLPAAAPFWRWPLGFKLRQQLHI